MGGTVEILKQQMETGMRKTVEKLRATQSELVQERDLRANLEKRLAGQPPEGDFADEDDAAISMSTESYDSEQNGESS